MNSILKDRKELLQEIVKVIKDARMPVSIEFVATNLGLNWATTRAALMELSLQGYLRATKTTKSWIFMLKEPKIRSTRSSLDLEAKIITRSPTGKT